MVKLRESFPRTMIEVLLFCRQSLVSIFGVKLSVEAMVGTKSVSDYRELTELPFCGPTRAGFGVLRSLARTYSGGLLLRGHILAGLLVDK